MLHEPEAKKINEFPLFLAPFFFLFLPLKRGKRRTINGVTISVSVPFFFSAAAVIPTIIISFAFHLPPTPILSTWNINIPSVWIFFIFFSPRLMALNASSRGRRTGNPSLEM